MAAEGSPLKLYNKALSSCSQRLRIALNLKGLEYEYLARSEKGTEPHTYTDKDLAAVNAWGQIPVLQIDGLFLSESSAILEYLEESRPESLPLLPKGPKERAYVRKLVQHVNAGTQSPQNSSILDRIEAKLGKEERLAWAQHFIDKGLTVIEENVRKSAGKYAVGDDITLADVFIAPQIANAWRFKLDVGKWPTLTKLEEVYNNHPAFIQAQPSQQWDFSK